MTIESEKEEDAIRSRYLNENPVRKDDRPSFRVIIAGGRDFTDKYGLFSFCDKILENKKITHRIVIYSGMAKGTDFLGSLYTQEHGYKEFCFQADWKKYGDSAGMIRNKEMLTNADALIAAWDGKSKGTANMIEIATAKLGRKMVKILRY